MDMHPRSILATVLRRMLEPGYFPIRHWCGICGNIADVAGHGLRGSLAREAFFAALAELGYDCEYPIGPGGDTDDSTTRAERVAMYDSVHKWVGEQREARRALMLRVLEHLGEAI